MHLSTQNIKFTNDDTQPRGRYVYTAISESLGERYEFPYEIDSQTQAFEFADDDWHNLVVDLPLDLDHAAGVAIRFVVDHPRMPAPVADFADKRELGVLVRQIALQ